MTITTTVSDVLYDGDGATLTFPYLFKVIEEAHLFVSINGVDVPQADPTYPWTPTGIGADGGGDIVFSSTPPPVGVDNVLIYRSVPLTQEVDYTPFDSFPSETHEGALDKLTMLVQEAREVAISGGDADTLNGLTSGQFVRSDEADLVVGPILSTNGFVGDIIGNAESADLSTNVNVIEVGIFPAAIALAGGVGTGPIRVDTGVFTYDPSAQILAVPNITGDVTGNVIGDVTGDVTGNVIGDVNGNADTATLADSSTNVNVIEVGIFPTAIALAGGVGTGPIRVDTGTLTYDPSAELLAVPNANITTTLNLAGVAITKSSTEINRSLFLPDAASPAIADVATRANTYLGFNAAGALAYLSGTGGTPIAADVSIVDAGGYYTGAQVEAALQEIASANWIPIATITVSTPIQFVDFIDVLGAGYHQHKVVIDDVETDSGTATSLAMVISDDSGVSWSTAFITAIASFSSLAQAVQSDVKVWNLEKTLLSKLAVVTEIKSGVNPVINTDSISETTVQDSIRIGCLAGNVTAGTFTVYGRRKI